MSRRLAAGPLFARRVAFAAAILLCGVAWLDCAHSAPYDAPPGENDASSPSPDAGGGADATLGHDTGAGPGVDASGDGYANPNDGAIDGGLDAPADAADAGVPVTGMSWPSGQVFPSFAPPGPLDVVDETVLDAGTQTLAVTLEGLVNRTKPRIFVTDQSTAQKLWLAKIGGTQTPVPDPLTLVAKYTTEIAGIVIYDDAVPDTLNLACTIAGVDGGIVASPGLATTLTTAPYSLPVLADLRTSHFASNLAVYEFELANYSSKTTNRLIVGLTPGIPDHLRDYAIATQAMMVWLDPTVPAQAALLDKFLALLPPNAPYMGWWTDEPSGVHQASTHGVPVYAADFSINLTVLGGTPRGSTPPQVPPPPPLENKVYVAIFMSDGDNLQEDEGLIPLKWSDPARGSVPISWTLDPAVVDVAPVILQYYQGTATVNDLLVSGPSGLGYTYPAAWPSAAVFDQYTVVSGHYMSTAGLDVATVWNNGADLSAANAQSYVTHVPNLLGLTIQSSTTPRQFVGNGLPIDEMSVSYAATEADLENGIDAVVKTFDGTKPVFAAVQGDMNMSTIQPSAFAATKNHYATNTHVEFVRADHYFKLLSRWNGGSAHETWSGDFNGDGKTDSLFYYAGNGDFWFGLSDGTNLVWSRAGNVAAQFTGYGSFLGPAYAFYPGDFNGDGKEDMLLYSGGDGNFWLGTSNGTALTWTNASASSGFGNLLDGKHGVRIGDFNGDKKADVAFYSAPDGNWWVGASNGTTLTWSGAGNTSGFGNLLDGSHAFYDGDFNGDGKADVLFFYNGDKSLWLGTSSGTSLAWSNVSASGFGNLIDDAHHLVAGDFNGDHRADLLFHSSGDGSWWLGASSGTGFIWSQASSTPTTTNLLDWNHRIFTLDADGDGTLDVVIYDSKSESWQIGLSKGGALSWSSAGSTSSYGDVADTSHLLFFGDYDGDGKKEPLFYSSDGNWWMSASNGTAFAWHNGGNTSGFGDLTH